MIKSVACEPKLGKKVAYVEVVDGWGMKTQHIIGVSAFPNFKSAIMSQNSRCNQLLQTSRNKFNYNQHDAARNRLDTNMQIKNFTKPIIGQYFTSPDGLVRVEVVHVYENRIKFKNLTTNGISGASIQDFASRFPRKEK